MTAKTDRKQKDHLFKKGQSGNPSGRPVGSRHTVSLLMEKLLDGEAEKLLKKALEMALAGDGQTLRALIDKLIPNRRDLPIRSDLPKVTAISDLSKLTAALLEAVGAGQLTPSEAATLARFVDAHGSAVELGQLEERIKAIEDKVKNHKK